MLQKVGEEGARQEGRRKNCGKIKTYSYELVCNCSNYILSCGESCKQDEKKFENWRSAEFSSEAQRCIPWRLHGWQRGETCRNRGESGIMGILWIWILERSLEWHKKSAGKPAASSISENSGNPEAERRKWPHNFYISSEVVSLFDCETDLS